MPISEVFKIIVSADTRGAVQEFKKLSAESAAAVQNAGGASAAGMSKLALSARVGAGALAGLGAVAAFEIGGRSVDAAADLQTAMLRVQSTFKGASGTVEEFAKKSAAGFGLSAAAAGQGAAVFGEYLVQLGYSKQAAADNAIQLLKIANGFAAMNNADPSAVIQAVSAAFRGEYDSLQRYLPAISDVAIRNKAVTMGLAENANAVDANARAQATLAILTEGGARATAFWEKAQNTAAGQTRQLQAEVTNLQAAFGEGLLPVLQTGVPILGALTHATATFQDKLKEIGGPLGRFLSGFGYGGLGTALASLVFGSDKAKKSTEDLSGAAASATSAVQNEADAAKAAAAAQKVMADATKRAADDYKQFTGIVTAATDAQAKIADADFERAKVNREVADAVKGVRDAEDGLRSAEQDRLSRLRDITDAQKALLRAEQAVADIRDRAAERERNNARDIERAQIRLADAKRNLRDAGTSNTANGFKDAQDAVRLAELDLADARDKSASDAKNAQQDIADAQQRVIDQQAAITKAQDDYKASIDGVADAASALNRAQEDAYLTLQSVAQSAKGSVDEQIAAVKTARDTYVAAFGPDSPAVKAADAYIAKLQASKKAVDDVTTALQTLNTLTPNGPVPSMAPSPADFQPGSTSLGVSGDLSGRGPNGISAWRGVNVAVTNIISAQDPGAVASEVSRRIGSAIISGTGLPPGPMSQPWLNTNDVPRAPLR